jgi:4-amino-4-deoxy-L-arabinose transferase-like glycosyltransferase
VSSAGTASAASLIRFWPRLGLAGILALALVLRCWRLGASGFITPYYMAGVRSMTVSWHNFFFNSFDPTGFVSLDKPPLAFWAQTLSAKLFGFGPVSVLLPQALEGLVSILVLYHLVRRVFGTGAGLFAALFLALMPIAVAVDRSNNTDTGLVLTLLLAAWALTRAVETGRVSFLLLAAGLVGIGFNIKMLVAFGVLPVFVLAYLAAAQPPLLQRIGHLVAAGVVLTVVSLSWAFAYDLTPPQNRPFVDSTSGNSMFELIVGENLIKRFVPRGDRLRQTAAAANPSADQTAAPILGRDYAPAGPLRLTAPHLAAQMGWLFPLALIGGLAAWWRYRGSPGQERRQLALWAGWMLTYGIVFSAAGGIFHAYYLVAMAPALSALAGIGLVALWSLYAAGGAASLVFPATLIATALWQGYIVGGYNSGYLAIGEKWLVPALLGASGLAAAGLLVIRPPLRAPAMLLGGLAISSLLAMQAAWSLGAVLVKGNTGFPAARSPFLNEAAETQRRRWSLVAGALNGDPKLLAFLEGNQQSEAFLLAAVNARQAAPIIIATGYPVIALGGFTGRDPILTVDGFARLVEDHRVRFALVGDGSPGVRRVFGEDGQKPLVDWIKENGRLVDPARWRTATPNGADGRRAAEAMGVQLYDLRLADDGG